MQNKYVSDVSLEAHPTAPDSAKVLKVTILDPDGISTLFTCDLFGGERVSDFKWNPNTIKLLTPGKTCLLKVAMDLVEKVGKNGAFTWAETASDELTKQIEEFHLNWRRKAFHEALRAYGVTKRLTFDQAIRVLEEYYVVEPIMEG